MSLIKKKVVYERRKRQYSDYPYSGNNIATLAVIVNAFTTVFLGDLIAHTHYYGETIKNYQKRLFQEEQSPWAYYLSVFVYKRIEEICNGKKRRDLWRFRFILLHMIIQSFGRIPPLNNEGKMAAFAHPIILALCEDKEFLEVLKNAEINLAQIMREYTGTLSTRNAHQDREFVEFLKYRYAELLQG
mgnify:FL=1